MIARHLTIEYLFQVIIPETAVGPHYSKLINISRSKSETTNTITAKHITFHKYNIFWIFKVGTQQQHHKYRHQQQQQQQ